MDVVPWFTTEHKGEVVTRDHARVWNKWGQVSEERMQIWILFEGEFSNSKFLTILQILKLVIDVQTDHVVSIALSLSLSVCCNDQPCSQTLIHSTFNSNVTPLEELVRVLLSLDAKKKEEVANADNNANTYTMLSIVESKERTALHLA